MTEVAPGTIFFAAEACHRNYYAKNSDQPYCQLVISPQLEKLREKFSPQLT